MKKNTVTAILCALLLLWASAAWADSSVEFLTPMPGPATPTPQPLSTPLPPQEKGSLEFPSGLTATYKNQDSREFYLGRVQPNESGIIRITWPGWGEAYTSLTVTRLNSAGQPAATLSHEEGTSFYNSTVEPQWLLKQDALQAGEDIRVEFVAEQNEKRYDGVFLLSEICDLVPFEQGPPEMKAFQPTSDYALVGEALNISAAWEYGVAPFQVTVTAYDETVGRTVTLFEEETRASELPVSFKPEHAGALVYELIVRDANGRAISEYYYVRVYTSEAAIPRIRLYTDKDVVTAGKPLTVFAEVTGGKPPYMVKLTCVVGKKIITEDAIETDGQLSWVITPEASEDADSYPLNVYLLDYYDSEQLSMPRAPFAWCEAGFSYIRDYAKAVRVVNEEARVPGDADDDGQVSLMDITAILQKLSQGTPIHDANADLNRDGRVDLNDAVLLLKRMTE